MKRYRLKNSGTAMVAAMLAVLALGACKPEKPLGYQQVQGVVGLSESEVHARLGGPHYLTDAGESVWWNYDGVTGANGYAVSCHVIFKAGIVDKVAC